MLPPRRLSPMILLLWLCFFWLLGACNNAGDDDSGADDDQLDDDQNDDDQNDDDQQPPDDDTSAEQGCAVTNVRILPPPAGNPLAVELLVQTDEPCSLSGLLRSNALAGHAISDPQQTPAGADHSLWFYGLAADTQFEYSLFRPEQPDKVLAAGTFTAPPLPAWMPKVTKVLNRPDATQELWVAVLLDVYIDEQIAMALLLLDREGRIRFYHQPLKDSTPYVLPDGGFFECGEQGLFIGLNGQVDIAYEVQLQWPFQCNYHHHCFTEGDFTERMILFNMLGPGVLCDLVTPTDMAVGDGVAVLNEQGQETWRWSVFDHQDEIPPEEMDQASCYSLYEDWGEGTVDWTHGNSVYPVPGEEAFTVSLRNMSRVIKVDRNTGEIIWQLGENLDFEWIGDEGIGFQHDAQILPNGHLLLFDNHFKVPWAPWSRALEVELDTEDMTARVFWEYHTPFGLTNGNVVRLDNGNTLISAGRASVLLEVAVLLEVNADGDELWRAELDLGDFGPWPGPTVQRTTPHPALWTAE